MFKLACLALLCAIVAVQCQDEKPWSKPEGKDSHEEQNESSEEHGGYEKRPQQMHKKIGKSHHFFKLNGDNNNDDVNVNVNVRVGGGAQQRPQWFGDRPEKGRPDREEHGGKRPRPDHGDQSSEEDEEHGGNHTRPSRPETNGSRPDGGRPSRPEGNSSRPDSERPARPEWNRTRPDGERHEDEDEEDDRDERRPGGKHGHGGKYGKGRDGQSDESDNSDNNDVNVNVNVQVNRGNRQNGLSQREGRGPRRPQIEGKGDHGHKKPDGFKKPAKPEANDESSSEQNE